MNESDCQVSGKVRSAAWIAGALGTFLLMALLVGVLIRLTRPEDLAAARARERRQFLQEVRQAEAQAIASYTWVAKDKGFVGVPIERSMEIVLAEWQNPAAARSNLIARVAKAKEPPPKPPEPANPYE